MLEQPHSQSLTSVVEESLRKERSWSIRTVPANPDVAGESVGFACRARQRTNEPSQFEPHLMFKMYRLGM